MMKHIGDFENFVQMEAICTYLKSFGYKAKLNNDTMAVEVQDLDGTIVNLTTWEAAREFIKVRAES